MKESNNQYYQTYKNIQQSGLDVLNIQPETIAPIIDSLVNEQKPNQDFYQIQQIGESFQKRPIFKITSGHGPIKILLWSQMHGNESTATASLFDLINFIKAPKNQAWFDSWKNKITLHIVPMLNPDGAKLVQRVNAQGIDINRDAKALQSPEGRLLLSLADDIKPDFGFNLHSQNRFYSVGDTSKSAVISLLAPAYNEAKETNQSRKKAKQLVSVIDKAVQSEYPGHVGRYNDTYSYRSFGDLCSAKGISTILIEAGYFKNDQNRQIPRWLTFLGLVESINAIKDESASENSNSIPLLNHYDSIPFNNEDALVDLLIKSINIENGFQNKGEDSYQVDIAVNYNDEFKNGVIDSIGDLSTLNGFSTIDLSETQIRPLKPFKLEEKTTLSKDQYIELLQQGYGYFTGDLSLLDVETSLPVIKNAENNDINNWSKSDALANFFICKDEQLIFAVIHGAVIKLVDLPRNN